MLKREMKINFKNFVIWLSILIGIFLVVFLIYPSIIEKNNIKMIDDMIKLFPEKMIEAFNMDISSLESAYGWLKTEGFIFVLLIIGCYSGLLGSSILLKEESDKTIEYLNSMPVKRNKIVLSKVITGVIYITLMVLLLAVFNYICLCLSGDFDKKQYILLSITPMFSSLVIFFFCLFTSTFTNKTKKMFGISLGFVLVSYVLQILSTLSTKTEFIKYFSVFTLADIRNVISKVSINYNIVFISIILSIALLILTLIRYNKKELV